MSEPTTTQQRKPGAPDSAAINEFKCLFTHDKRQKRKRWKDGLLRFHTFNKRIMIYDEPQNFVGDMHYRRQDPLSEGDELEFETFLVEVQEALCTVQQDLTGMQQSLDARRAERQMAHKAQQVTLTQKGFSRAFDQARIDQLAARPLKSVLAANRGTIGRTSMQQLSPYDMRKARTLEDKENGLSVKRRKVAETEHTDLSSSPTFNDVPPARRNVAPSLQAALARRGTAAKRPPPCRSSPILVHSNTTPSHTSEDDGIFSAQRPQAPSSYLQPRKSTVQGTLSRRFDNASSRVGPKLLCSSKTGPIVQRNLPAPLVSDGEADEQSLDEEAALFGKLQREKMEQRLKGLGKATGSTHTPAKKGIARKKALGRRSVNEKEECLAGQQRTEPIEVITLDDDSPAPIICSPARLPRPHLQSPRSPNLPIPKPTDKRYPPPIHDPMDDYIEADFALPSTAPAPEPQNPDPQRLPPPGPLRPLQRAATVPQPRKLHKPPTEAVPVRKVSANRPLPAAPPSNVMTTLRERDVNTRAKPGADQIMRGNVEKAGGQDVGMDTAPRAVEPEKADDEDTGPWSREAYDLFGDWRPPGRGAIYV